MDDLSTVIIIMRCFVPTCSNFSDKRRPQGVSFHKIPESTKEKWLLAIKRCADDLTGDRRVCSDHFVVGDWFLGNRKILKPGIIPTLKLPPNKSARTKKRFLEPRPAEVNTCNISPTEIPITEGDIEFVSVQDEHSCFMVENQIQIEDTQNSVQLNLEEEQDIIKEELQESSSGINPYHFLCSATSTTSDSSMKRISDLIKVEHNYSSRSSVNYNKKINYHARCAYMYKTKYESVKRTSIRRKEKISRLKDIVLDLKKKHALSTIALENLKQSSGIPSIHEMNVAK